MSYGKRFSGLAPVDGVAGVEVKGICQEVISASAATLTLTPQQSGALIELNRAAGTAITLPAASSCLDGTVYHVVVGVALTGNCTCTRSGSDAVVGNIQESEIDTGTDGSASAAGTVVTNVATAETVGDHYEIKKGASTTWYVRGGCAAQGGITIS